MFLPSPAQSQYSMLVRVKSGVRVAIASGHMGVAAMNRTPGQPSWRAECPAGPSALWAAAACPPRVYFRRAGMSAEDHVRFNLVTFKQARCFACTVRGRAEMDSYDAWGMGNLHSPQGAF